ncbi:MAG: winged helix DNA-binding domain-containing protein [Chitinophagales bacterium]
MKETDIVWARLLNQQLINSKLADPQEVVSHLVAIQAQEYEFAKWAIALRCPSLSNQQIEAEFNKGNILRTHLLRPTWHFVAPKDIRWLLQLTAPQVIAVSRYMLRQLELDDKLFNRSNRIIEKNLEGKHLTRAELRSILEKNKIIAEGPRLSYICMKAELDGIICSGARKGKQFTYALLEERVAPAKKLNRKEALYELTNRYFASRGPATLKDFSVWSGLKMKDVRAGTAMLDKKFEREIIDKQELIFIPQNIEKNKMPELTFLLPDYDEYGMSYKGTSANFNVKIIDPGKKRSFPTFNHIIIIDGQVAGTWKQTKKPGSITIDTNPFFTLNKTKDKFLNKAVGDYIAFMLNEAKKKRKVKTK